MIQYRMLLSTSFSSRSRATLLGTSRRGILYIYVDMDGLGQQLVAVNCGQNTDASAFVTGKLEHVSMTC